jgi:hypothetical protein
VILIVCLALCLGAIWMVGEFYRVTQPKCVGDER